MLTGIFIDIIVSSSVSLEAEKGDRKFCPSMTESYRDHLQAGSLKTLFFGLSSTDEEKSTKAYSECQHLFKKMITNKYPSYFVSQWMIWALALHIWVSNAAADSTKKDERALIRLVVMLGMCLYRFWTGWSSSVAFNGFYTLCNNYFPLSEPKAQSYNFKCISMLDKEKVVTSDPNICQTCDSAHAFFHLHKQFMYTLLLSYMVNLVYYFLTLSFNEIMYKFLFLSFEIIFRHIY